MHFWFLFMQWFQKTFQNTPGMSPDVLETMPMQDIFDVPVPPEPEPAPSSPKRDEILTLPTLALGENLTAEEAVAKLPEGDGETGDSNRDKVGDDGETGDSNREKVGDDGETGESNGETMVSNGGVEEPGVASKDGYEIPLATNGDQPSGDEHFDAMYFQDITCYFFASQDFHLYKCCGWKGLIYMLKTQIVCPTCTP